MMGKVDFLYEECVTEMLLEAGKIQIDGLNQKLEVNEKESLSSIVSEIDLKCDHVICEKISGNFPEHNLLSEENGFIDRQSEYTWVIDPLDGTSNYVAGLPWFGVLIALFKNSEPICAGAYLPLLNELFYAEKGKGAWLNSQKIVVMNSKMKESLFAFSTDATYDEAYLNYGLTIYRYLINNCRNVRSTNSLIDLLYVSSGKMGGCVNLFTKIWDIAAPYLIIEEAGGKMTSIDYTDLIFDFSSSGIEKNYGIIAVQNPKLILDLQLNV